MLSALPSRNRSRKASRVRSWRVPGNGSWLFERWCVPMELGCRANRELVRNYAGNHGVPGSAAVPGCGCAGLPLALEGADRDPQNGDAQVSAPKSRSRARCRCLSRPPRASGLSSLIGAGAKTAGAPASSALPSLAGGARYQSSLAGGWRGARVVPGLRPCRAPSAGRQRFDND